MEAGMADELVFYTNPMSRGRIVRWMLEELGQPYRTEVLDFPAMKQPAYLAVNPMGKVPAIRHGDEVVTEAAAICTYLADAFPQAGLAPPPGSHQRAPYYRWLFFAAGPAEQAITAKSCSWEVPTGRNFMVGFGSMEAVLDTLERFLEGRQHVAGDSFTAADLYLSAQLGWAMQVGAFEKRPAFQAYVQRHAGRPAALRAAEIDGPLGVPRPQPA
jgi:glutathione S-transferase